MERHRDPYVSKIFLYEIEGKYETLRIDITLSQPGSLWNELYNYRIDSSSNHKWKDVLKKAEIGLISEKKKELNCKRREGKRGMLLLVSHPIQTQNISFDILDQYAHFLFQPCRNKI